jgi:putative ABC transport system permease protein
MVVFEGAMLGVVGGCLGLAVGAAVTKIIAAHGIPMPQSPGISMAWVSQPLVASRTLIFSFSLALAAAVVSSFLPAYYASRMDISESLRHLN